MAMGSLDGWVLPLDELKNFETTWGKLWTLLRFSSKKNIEINKI
jgi:hypothetical protein